MLITVRPPQACDEAEIAEVDRLSTEDLRKVYRPAPAAVELRTSIANRLQRLVATVNDRVVATVQYYFNGDCVAVLELGVHPESRRHGLARALVEELERIGEATGATALTLYTIRQTGNVAIFESLGFSVESEQPTSLFESASGDALTEVLMKKHLQPGSCGGAT